MPILIRVLGTLFFVFGCDNHIQNDAIEYQSNTIEQNNLKRLQIYTVKNPKYQTYAVYNVHIQRKAGHIFCYDRFYRLGQKRDCCTCAT